MKLYRKTLLSLLVGTTLTACGGGNTSEDSVDQVTMPSNIVPVANAGVDFSVNLGQKITLDGTASNDDDGDTLTYVWQVIGGPEISFVFGDSPTQTFTPNIEGSYEVSLSVSDGKDTSASDTVVVTVIKSNTPPVAEIAGNTEDTQGNLLSLSAESSSDSDGDSLSYIWLFETLPEGSLLTSEDLVQEINTSFIPDVAGEYVIHLTVNDGTNNSETVSYTIDIQKNQTPLVEAEIDISFRLGGEAYIYSSVTDQDNSEFSFEWEITSAPEASELVGLKYNKPYLTYIPDVAGEYSAKVTVSDGYNVVESEEVVATIADKYEYNYQIGGGTQYFGKINEPVLIDFAASISPQGKELEYSWSLRSGPNGSRPSLSKSIVNKAETEFTADKVGDYRIFVTMTDKDGYGNVESIYVKLFDEGTNTVPTAKTMNPHFIKLGESINLNGLNSFDVENDLIDLHWEVAYQPPGSGLVISEASNIKQSVTPTLPGYYNLLLNASDEESSGRSYSAGWFYVYENLTKPTALTQMNIMAKVNEVITLNGSGSVGIDESITAQWDLINSPYNSTAELNHADALNPTFEIDVEGKFIFQLRLLDGDEVVSIEHLTVRSANNVTPIANAGEDMSIVAGENVNLSGSLSSDKESDALTFKWNIVSISTNSPSVPKINNDSLENPTLLVDENFSGQVVVGLTVSDSDNTSIRDEVIITVEEATVSAKLERLSLSTFTAAEVDLPYLVNEVIQPLSEQAGDGNQILAMYYLHAEHGGITLTNIKFTDKNETIEPTLSIVNYDFAQPRDEQVELNYMKDINVDKNDFILISIISPADTGGKTAQIELGFDIVETGDSFKAAFDYTSG